MGAKVCGDVIREIAWRELARRHYADYLAYSQGATWIRTRMSTFLTDLVQEFIEEDTGHAYCIEYETLIRA